MFSPKQCVPLCPVDIGEALGLYHTIQWIHDLPLTNVDFEVDL